MIIPQNAKPIEVIGSTVPFFEDEDTYYFDSSLTTPPEPMLNAIVGLQLLDHKHKLVMINHKSPMGLFPKIKESFDYEVVELPNDIVKVVFIKKTNVNINLSNADTSCGGSGCMH